jgi:hypothetical protein
MGATQATRSAWRAAWAWVVLLVAGQPVLAADRAAGTSYFYPGAPVQSGNSYSRQPAPAGGNYRPTDSAVGQWQGQGQQALGSSSGGTPSAWGQGGTTTWYGQGTSGAAEAWPGQPAHLPSEYRFRPRPDDKSTKSDESLRYRPDPDLARRSQQSWGIPGQEWQPGGAPGAIFRPLRPDEEPPGRSAKTEQHYGQPPPWSGLPAAPGYGYPY